MLGLTHTLFIRNRTHIAQRRMSPNPVVKAFDILEDGLPGLSSCLERKAFDAFAFECPEKRFGDRVIVTVASAAHAHCGADIREQGLIGITGILRSPIRMKQHSRWWVPTKQRHLESPLNERFVLGRSHGPSNHPTRVEIKHHCQVEPPFVGPDRCNIASPLLIGTSSR